MRVFKLIDVLVSVVLVTICTIAYFQPASPKTLTSYYFIAGSWQAISMAIHARNKWFTRKYSPRYIYHRVAFASWIAIAAGSGQLFHFAAPVLLFFYTGLCVKECLVKIRRPIYLLKNER